MAAEAGDYSILAISAQVYHEISLGEVVPAELFTPPPRVDSQVVILHRRPEPLVHEGVRKEFFQLVKAGFSAKRKKLRSSLSGGLRLSKEEIENLLDSANISPGARAEGLSIEQWLTLLKYYDIIKR